MKKMKAVSVTVVLWAGCVQDTPAVFTTFRIIFISVFSAAVRYIETESKPPPM